MYLSFRIEESDVCKNGRGRFQRTKPAACIHGNAKVRMVEPFATAMYCLPSKV